jgi:class 3 adenylate cyclase/trans-aconitate methyltransferase
MATTTILFTDLVNSSEILGRLGDRAAHHIFRNHYQTIRATVEANGGEVVKWQGDGVMASFQSVADAVRAAVAGQRATERSIQGERLGMRVGLHVGDTMTWDAADLFGTPVVVARRLCEAAGSGQVLSSSLVMGLLPGRQELKFRDLGFMKLKGIDEPVSTFELLWELDTPPHRWTEDESQQYLELSAVAIPARDEQIATIVALLPFEAQSHFDVLDLGAGEGALSFAILNSYPNASLIALDGSESMRARAGATVERFGERVSVRPFDLNASDWLPLINSSDVVVSSLLLHHLPDKETSRFFHAVFDRLRQPGAFLIADVVQAQRSEQLDLYADTYDAIVLAQSLLRTGSEDAYEVFSDRKWNIFRYSLPADEYPCPLIDSLSWLRSTGFEGVDCFWLRAGFAIFGGYKGPPRSGVGVSFDAALRSARLGLSVISEL